MNNSSSKKVSKKSSKEEEKTIVRPIQQTPPPQVFAFASSANMVPPEPSRIPHPEFKDGYEDGELI